MSARLSLALCLVSLAGCPSQHGTDAPLPDAPLADAGPPGPDAGPDAPADAPLDAPVLSGCFDDAVRVFSSSAGPSARAHVQISALAAFSGGWLLVVEDTASGRRLLVLDPAGRVVSDQEAPLFAHTIVVEGDAAFVFGGYQVVRYDLAATRATLREGGLYVGGLAFRPEGVLATEARPEGGVRALSHHYDELAGRSRLILSDVTLDDASPSGLRQVSSELEPIPEVEPFYDDRFFLSGDHLWIVNARWAGRVRDVQLAGSGATLGYRIWSDEPWEVPYLFLGLTADRSAAFVVRLAEGDVPAGGIETLPPGTGSIAVSGLDFSGPQGALDLGDGRVLVATTDAFSVVGRYSGVELSRTPLEAGWSASVGLAAGGEIAAIAFSEAADGGDRHVALRCVRLPARW